ncbi:hypothetical protein GCM10020216_032890 [Nonomuraea helvata]
MPGSRSTGSTRSSTSRVHSEYSDWTAATGRTAWARRIVSGPASDRLKEVRLSPPNGRHSLSRADDELAVRYEVAVLAEWV